jgi:hypothetical protein
MPQHQAMLAMDSGAVYDTSQDDANISPVNCWKHRASPGVGRACHAMPCLDA